MLLGQIAGALNLNAAGYQQLVTNTKQLVRQPEFKRLRTGLAYAALEFGPRLDETTLTRLIEVLMDPDEDITESTVAVDKTSPAYKSAFDTAMSLIRGESPKSSPKPERKATGGEIRIQVFEC